MPPTTYHIFGDIHGHADQLQILLLKMGYVCKGATYTPPIGCKAIFVGDLIDRGPKIRETLQIVKSMCDAGHAHIVMGNHEWNAICFHTPHTEKGGFFREHRLSEIEQHLETLRQFKNKEEEWQMYLDWFKTIPLFLELERLRIVHACWDQSHIDWLQQNYNGITTEFLNAASQKDSRAYSAIDETLKGKEYPLPDGLHFTDKDGAKRHHCRIKWWQPVDKRKRYGDVLMHCPEPLNHKALPSNNDLYQYTGETPVFFGHYWLREKPEIENKKAICLDYSVAKHGVLVCAEVRGTEEIKLVF